MAGHSQFKNIMHRKGAQDAKKAKLLSKVTREIISACKTGAPDPAMNPRLRAAIQWAREENMPRDKIEAAVKRGSGSVDTDNYEPMRYEGYGPGGTAVLIEGSTDNPNRTVAEIRHAFSRNGGNLGASNSVAWMFDRKGQIVLAESKRSEDEAMEAALESGASDFTAEDGIFLVSTEPTDIHAVEAELKRKGWQIESSEIEMIPKNLVAAESEEARKVLRLIEMLEELDDVSKVFSNLDPAVLDLEEEGA